MKFTIVVEVEVERIEGKFVSRDDIADVLLGAIESADPGSMYVGDGSEYECVTWDVNEVPQPKRGRK